MNLSRFEQNPNHLPPAKDEPLLHRAARLGDHDAIRNLIASGIDVDGPFDIRLDPGGREAVTTPLMVAAGSGDGASIETMRLLLKLKADPLKKFNAGSIARFAAGGLGWNYVPGGDADRLKLCLELGSDPNEMDERGVTLVAEAARTGDFERVKALIDASANPNVPAIAGTLPLSKFKLDLPNFPSPYKMDAPRSFQIPLHCAVEADDFESVRYLLEAGADPGALDNGLENAFFLAKSEKVAKFLVKSGLNPEAENCLGWSPLVGAVNAGDLQAVSALLAAGANVNATHDRGFTVFMSAVGSSERRLEVMKELVDAGADPHAISELGWNAFHACVDVDGPGGDTHASIHSTISYLKSMGVDINHRNNNGESPLQIARHHGRKLEIEALIEFGAKD